MRLMLAINTTKEVDREIRGHCHRSLVGASQRRGDCETTAMPRDGRGSVLPFFDTVSVRCGLC